MFLLQILDIIHSGHVLKQDSIHIGHIYNILIIITNTIFIFVHITFTKSHFQSYILLQ